MRTAEIPFADYCGRVQQRIEHFYGIKVVTRDIPDPLTGDLDGKEIHIDQALNQEQRLFLLAHLFGHTVQWNVDPAAFELGRQYQPPVEEAVLPMIIEYEREAARYGLKLCQESGASGIDEWFSTYTACDQKYLLHFYRTGKKCEFSGFWSDDVPIVQPKSIPPFTPTRRALRMNGIVI
jgi:hypothetical protein